MKNLRSNTYDSNKSGYKHSKVGWIPENWNIRRLDEIVDKRKKIRYGIVQTGINLPDGIPCLRVVDLSFSNIDVKNLIRTSEKINYQYRDTILKENDIVLILRGDIGKCLIIPKELEGINITRGLARIRCSDDYVTLFIQYQIQSSIVKKELLLQVNGTSLKEIPINGLKNVVIPVPELKAEQQKIAQILSTWDKAIEKTEQLIQAKTQLKKGLMQQLLTGKKRFPGYKGEWDEMKVGSVFDFIRSYSFTRADLDEEGSVQYIHYGDIHKKFEDEILDLESNVQLPFIKPTGNEFNFLVDGDVVMADASEDYEGVGECVEIKNINDNKVIAGLHTIALRDKSGKTEKGFRTYLFLNLNTRKELRKIATGISVYGISKSSISNVELLIPIPSEQVKISKILFNVSSEIRILTSQLKCLLKQKKGMMQKLLTGEIRVKTQKPK